MTDINQYANDLLLEFLDEFHEFLKYKLGEQYGDEWLSQGIERHLGRAYFDRVREMLNSPMKVVDLGRGDEDLYGVEHLANIVDGNWSILEGVFQDRTRTKVYLGEITELRHNLAHRRKRHYLRRDDLLRFVQNARMFLDAIKSKQSDKFGNVLESIMGGGIPWGVPLAGHLPPQDEIVDEFVERKREHDILGEWLVNDSPQFVLWGYGGAGKSATAYKFAQEVQEAAPASLQAVCWVSAKREEFGDGQVRPHGADFHDRTSFCTAVWNGLYDTEFPSPALASEELLRELKETRTLLIVDDIDTVIDDQDLTGFLLYDLRNSGSKILYTSRLELPGLPNEEVKPFNEEQLTKFVQFRCHEYELSESACLQRLSGIASVTGSYPLFVDDLLRHASISGIDSALEAWSQRKGDAAREYALRRQLEHLGTGSLDTLMTLSVASRPLRAVEIGSIAGLTDNDVELAIRDLLRWRLVNRVTTENDVSPGFNLNSNTRRLVQKTYSTDARMKGYQTALRSLSGERVPEAKRAAIGRVIKRAGEILFQGNLEGAAEHIKSAMTGELTDSPDLYGTLGWVYSRDPRNFAEEASTAFMRAHRLGIRKEDSYFHWASMEREVSESLTGRVGNAEVLEQWRLCAQVAEWGIERAGKSDALCHMIGYARSREAKCQLALNQFTSAQSAFGQALEWFKEAWEAPRSKVHTVSNGAIYRGLVIAFDGIGDVESLARTFKDWKAASVDEYHYGIERDRILRFYSELRGRI